MQLCFPSLLFIAYSCYVIPFWIISAEHACFLKMLIIQARFVVPYLKAIYSTSLASWIYVFANVVKLISPVFFPSTPQQGPSPLVSVSTWWVSVSDSGEETSTA